MNISKRYMLIAIVLNGENQLDCAIPILTCIAEK